MKTGKYKTKFKLAYFFFMNVQAKPFPRCKHKGNPFKIPNGGNHFPNFEWHLLPIATAQHFFLFNYMSIVRFLG